MAMDHCSVWCLIRDKIQSFIKVDNFKKKLKTSLNIPSYHNLSFEDLISQSKF
jgi:hypothetical protein